MIRGRLVFLVGVTAALTLRPLTVHAQLEAFVQAVRELADATGRAEPARVNEIRAAADHMGAALAEWDRHISALEARVTRESAAAPAQRAFQLHVELGVAYCARGRTADALREFDAARPLQPSASDLQVLRALTLEAAGRSGKAGEAFLAAWTLDARNPVKAYYAAGPRSAGSAAQRDRARGFLTDTYRSLGGDVDRPATAPFVTLGAIPDNLSRTPVVADDATAGGFALLGAGKYDEGVAALRRPGQATGAKAGDSARTHLARGQRDEAQNRVAEARREYQAALTGALAGRSVLLVAIARLAEVDGDSAGAIDALTQAAQLSPNDPGIRKELAGAYAARGRADDAFCELMAALLIDPRDAQVHSAIGQLYLDTGREAEAVAAFTRALQLMPSRYEIRYALATAHTRLGHTAEAARQLEIFEDLRRAAQEQRRREIANEVEQEEAIRRAAPNQGGAR
jgi:tetratricopeptide (TPR) repeat protein